MSKGYTGTLDMAEQIIYVNDILGTGSELPRNYAGGGRRSSNLKRSWIVQAPRALISKPDLLFCVPGLAHGRRKYLQLRLLIKSCKRQACDARRYYIALTG